MTTTKPPVVIEAAELQALLDSDPSVQLIDLGSPELYAQAHIEGAISFDYAWLVSGAAPAAGKLPELASIVARLESSGIGSDAPMVIYDGEGSGKAARMCWTLDVLGFSAWSLLNGGLAAWANAGLPLSNESVAPTRTSFNASDARDTVLAQAPWLIERLGSSDLGILDARTPAEHLGQDVRSARGGHIPGAQNLNWMDTMDPQDNGRLKDPQTLRDMLAERGLTPDQEIVTYCQTHHRSAHSYVMLKSLGYERIRGYDGSWSEWGNLPDTPIEAG